MQKKPEQRGAKSTQGPRSSDGGTSLRLAKFLASAGIASRRACEELIRQGRVQVNGEVVLSPALNIDPEADVVKYDDKLVQAEQKVYLLLHKPVGFTCSASDPYAKRLVYELVPKKFGRLFTVGRLDRESEGLLILTNDGDFAQRLSHPSQQVPRRYLVACEGYFTSATRRQMLKGVHDEGELLQATSVKQRGHLKGHAELEIALTSGKKREIRRLCKAVDLEVTSLQRISFGSIELGSLPPGHWRLLDTAEIEALAQGAPKKHTARRPAGSSRFQAHS
ncbi:MAG: rRNA pseudouridine synthase [Oligosphaeraceae bacterium]|nr:rRNA pseudouridine synthase [Oligosphaeraceae bacterium]